MNQNIECSQEYTISQSQKKHDLLHHDHHSYTLKKKGDRKRGRDSEEINITLYGLVWVCQKRDICKARWKCDCTIDDLTGEKTYFNFST
jgi:hypothetical protein